MTAESTFPTKLECPEPSVAPGEALRCVLRVYNPREEIDEYVVRGVGEAEGWVRTSPEQLRLLPETDGTVDLVLTVPEAAAVEAGERVVELQVVSALTDVPKQVPLTFTLTPVTRLDVVLEPRQQDTTGPATFTVEVRSDSNHAVQVQLQAEDPSHAVQLHLQPPALRVAAFTRATATLRATPPETSPAEPRPYPVSVRAETVDPPGPGAHATAQAVLVHQPPEEPPPPAGWVLSLVGWLVGGVTGLLLGRGVALLLGWGVDDLFTFVAGALLAVFAGIWLGSAIGTWLALRLRGAVRAGRTGVLTGLIDLPWAFAAAGAFDAAGDGDALGVVGTLVLLVANPPLVARWSTLRGTDRGGQSPPGQPRAHGQS